MNSADEGQQVWKALAEQLAELRGFVNAAVGAAWERAKKRALWLLAAAAVGAALGWGMAARRPAVYRAESVATYTLMAKKVYGDMLVKLNDLAQRNEHASLALLLGVDRSQAEALLAVEGTNILGDPLHEDVTSDNSPFKIILYLRDSATLPSLEVAVANYLNSSAYVQERLRFNTENETKNIADLEQQLSRMFSDRSAIIAGEGDATALAALAETIEVTRKQLKDARIYLAFNRNVEFLDGFILATDTLNADPWKGAVQYAAGALLLALAVVWWRG